MENTHDKIDPIHIEDEMQRAYIDYSMSVIVGRALPDARDGLKPGNRRILFAMKERGWTYSKAFVKCAKVVGEVIGNYHPHGDAAVYDTLVRMAQDFSMRAPLIKGQGNFGSLDGDPPAAYRYTECKLERLAEEMLADIDKETVDMQPNFDESLQEPKVLPARVPNLLVNGSTGIAVGMATNIPPHNLGEVVDGCVHLIDNPDATVTDLTAFIKGPDFPTGGVIHGKNAIKQMYETGRGHIKIRGRATIEETATREVIIITEIPYAVNKAVMIEKIADLVRDKKLEGISDIRDESDENIRVVIELKKGVIAQVVLNNLLQQTQLEVTFGAIMLAIDKGRPKVLNLREILQCFLDHRFEVTKRRIQFDLKKAEARAHILEGLKIAIDNLDAVVKIIRDSKNRDDARTQLMTNFKLSEIQANAILEMRLYQLTGLERDKLEEEYLEVIMLINYLRDLLSSDKKIFEVIKADLLEIRKQYANERRTDIVPDEGEINMEDLIADAGCVIALTHGGYVKRVPLASFRQQNRGGRGVAGMDVKDEDYVEHVFNATTHDSLLFFTQHGDVFMKKVYEYRVQSRGGKGVITMKASERNGPLVAAHSVHEHDALMITTQKGVMIRMPVDGIRVIGRNTQGVRLINLDEGDKVVSATTVEPEDETPSDEAAGTAPVPGTAPDTTPLP